MLKLNGVDFTVGRARYVDDVNKSLEETSKIYVKIIPSDLEAPILAQLDTGSPWPIFERGASEYSSTRSAAAVLETGERFTLLNRHGWILGGLHRRL